LEVRFDGFRQLLFGAWNSSRCWPLAHSRGRLDTSVGGPQGAAGMISYQYWQRRFALDPAVLGRRITLNGAPLTVVGVTPQHFFGLDLTPSRDLTLPFTLFFWNLYLVMIE
jgi:hypothetical protein